MKVGIVGGGASGMMAAILAARGGADVTILEHKDRVGKKILTTGNGRCNLSNLLQTPECYRGSNPEFGWQVVEQFPVEKTLKFFQKIGLYTIEKNGYLYPYAEQASTVLDLMRMELEHMNVRVCAGIEITSIQKDKQFIVKTSEEAFVFQKLILATGSKAAPVTGSDGSGYRYAKQFGHTIKKPLPALVQLRAEGKFFQSVAGVRTRTDIKLYGNDTLLAEEKGELQLTAYGLSGIPIMQMSRYAAQALDRKQNVTAYINFQPDFDADSWMAFVEQRLDWNGYKTLEDFLLGLLNKKLIPVICREASVSAKKIAWELKKKDWMKLAQTITAFPVVISGTNDFKDAQVCMGGVDTSQIEVTTMESKRCKDLYIIGELLDVDGTCGGYNLQFAWSSGYLAGTACGNG